MSKPTTHRSSLLVANPYQPVDQNQPLIPRLYRYFNGERPG